MSASHVTEEMRAAVGRVSEWRVSYPVAGSDIRRWAIATHYPDDPPRRYWDEEYAARLPGGLTAPEEFNPFAWMVAARMAPAIATPKGDPDRLEQALGITGPGLANLINAGSSATYGVPMRPGDVIRSESRLAGYEERSGQRGSLLITSIDIRWTNQRDQLVLTGLDSTIRY